MRNEPSVGEFSSGSLILLMTVIIWGLQFPVAKTAFETVNSFHSAIFRFAIPAIMLFIIMLIIEGRDSVRPQTGGWAIAALGVLGMCCGPALIFGGLMFTRPEIAAIIVATQPILAVIVQRVAGGTLPGILSISCITIAFLGVVTVVTQWNVDLQLTRLEIIGDVMVFSGAVCWVTYTFTCGHYQNWSTLRLTTWCMLSGTLANAALVFLLVALGLLTHPSLEAWYSVRYELTFLAFIGVLAAMFGWNVGARKLGALNAMLFINLIPIVTFFVRYLQGYRFTWMELLGVAMVIGALLTQNFFLRQRIARGES